jgi:acetylornithine deacetylase/succinyl-diaminopimelate desuccinylase-like protein
MTLFDTYKKLLTPLIAIRSVSADPHYAHEMRRAVAYLEATLLQHGFQVAVMKTEFAPVILATYAPNPEWPTVLVYGHYDVQPADQREGWDSDPFTLIERDGRFYARGATDNKGQCMIHIATVCSLITEDKIRCNVTFLIEGNEETGSSSLSNLLETCIDQCRCDCVLISDSELMGENPTLDRGFRGVINLDLTVITSPYDLHSGIFGGAVPNAAHELAHLLDSVHTPDGKVAIPAFYEKLPEPTPATMEFTKHDYCSLTGSDMVFSCIDNPSEQLGLTTAFEVTSLVAGYQGEGHRNSIPGEAKAKINIRTAPTQEDSEIITAVKEHCEKHLPSYVKWDLEVSENCPGLLIDNNNPYAHQTKKLLEEVYGNPVVERYCGGSLPVVHDLARLLNVPQLLVALANEDCRMHEANENLRIKEIKKGLEFSQRFFTELKKTSVE